MASPAMSGTIIIPRFDSFEPITIVRAAGHVERSEDIFPHEGVERLPYDLLDRDLQVHAKSGS
jgi:hypothetical protein